MRSPPPDAPDHRSAGTGPVLFLAALLLGWTAGRHVTSSPLSDDVEARPGLCLDVNAATAAELTLLPGIGDGLARRIVTHRATAGPYATLDELQSVPGIGPATVERIRAAAAVEAPRAAKR